MMRIKSFVPGIPFWFGSSKSKQSFNDGAPEWAGTQCHFEAPFYILSNESTGECRRIPMTNVVCDQPFIEPVKQEIKSPEVRRGRPPKYERSGTTGAPSSVPDQND